MKMAKASQADLNMALDLISVLDDIEKGYFPYRFDPESESIEWLDTQDSQQYDKLIDNLRRLLNRGSIGRVIMGMAVVCDPSNECIDPDADTIEHHPKRQQLEKQCDELLAALKKMNRAYVGLMENGRDRIIMLGGDCDPVDVMERNDPNLRESRAAIANFPHGSLGEAVESERGEP